jgi:hypothetical protein
MQQNINEYIRQLATLLLKINKCTIINNFDQFNIDKSLFPLVAIDEIDNFKILGFRLTTALEEIKHAQAKDYTTIHETNCMFNYCLDWYNDFLEAIIKDPFATIKFPEKYASYNIVHD